MAAEPGEHALVLVGVDVQTARLLVAQRVHQRPPPPVREVLRLVHDDGVEPLPVGQCGGQVRHTVGQATLPEVAVLPGAALGTPGPPQLLEGADERRSPLAAQAFQLATEVLRQADRVAQQSHPLRRPVVAAARQVLGLGERQDGLAAARSPAHLDPVEQPRHPQQRGLLDREPVCARGTFVGLGRHVLHGEPSAAQDLDDQSHVVVRGRSLVRGAGGYGAQPICQVALVAPALDHPPRAVRGVEVVVDRCVGHDHCVAPPDPGARRVAPPWVALDVVPDGITGLAGLADGVDASPAVARGRPPLPLCVARAAASLDLDHHDPLARQQQDEVGLVVLGLVGESEPGQHHGVVRQGSDQPLPHPPLTVGVVLRILRYRPSRHRCPLATSLRAG